MIHGRGSGSGRIRGAENESSGSPPTDRSGLLWLIIIPICGVLILGIPAAIKYHKRWRLKRSQSKAASSEAILNHALLGPRPPRDDITQLFKKRVHEASDTAVHEAPDTHLHESPDTTARESHDTAIYEAPDTSVARCPPAASTTVRPTSPQMHGALDRPLHSGAGELTGNARHDRRSAETVQLIAASSDSLDNLVTSRRDLESGPPIPTRPPPVVPRLFIGPDLGPYRPLYDPPATAAAAPEAFAASGHQQLNGPAVPSVAVREPTPAASAKSIFPLPVSTVMQRAFDQVALLRIPSLRWKSRERRQRGSESQPEMGSQSMEEKRSMLYG
jgi:hypothetical protein